MQVQSKVATGTPILPPELLYYIADHLEDMIYDVPRSIQGILSLSLTNRSLSTIICLCPTSSSIFEQGHAFLHKPEFVGTCEICIGQLFELLEYIIVAYL